MNSVPDSMQQLIEALFQVIEQEHPPLYRLLWQKMLNCRFNLCYQDECFGLGCSHARGPHVTATHAAPDVKVALTERVLFQLIDGRLRVADALWKELIGVYGTLASLDRLDAVFSLFVRGAVHSPGAERVFHAFRRARAIGSHQQGARPETGVTTE